MKIALLQAPAIMGVPEENLKIAAKLIKKATVMGADTFVFPEMSLTGYFDKAKQMKYSISVDDQAVHNMVALSDEGKMIIFGISEKRGINHYITQVVAENGKLIGTYEKHNLAEEENKSYLPGNKLPVFKKDGLKFGITICADIDLENLYKSYKDKGCDIVFECASPDLYGDKETRNWENGYRWWQENCIEKLGKYSKKNRLKIAVATMSGRNEYGDFPGGGYLFSEEGILVAKTSNYQDEMLIISL